MTREETLERLWELPLEALARVVDWSRPGRQANVGPVTLADLPAAQAFIAAAS
jgi:hypothetical protein